PGAAPESARRGAQRREARDCSGQSPPHPPLSPIRWGRGKGEGGTLAERTALARVGPSKGADWGDSTGRAVPASNRASFSRSGTDGLLNSIRGRVSLALDVNGDVNGAVRAGITGGPGLLYPLRRPSSRPRARFQRGYVRVAGDKP